MCAPCLCSMDNLGQVSACAYQGLSHCLSVSLSLCEGGISIRTGVSLKRREAMDVYGVYRRCGLNVLLALLLCGLKRDWAYNKLVGFLTGTTTSLNVPLTRDRA